MKNAAFLLLLLVSILVLAVDAITGDLNAVTVASRRARMHYRKTLNRSVRSMLRKSKPCKRLSVELKDPEKMSANKIDSDVGPSARGEVLTAVSNDCGSPDATKKTTAINGPNGRLDWLNCGINGGGWNPPYLHVDQIVSVPLGDAVGDPKSPFKACMQFLPLFEKYAKQHGYSATILASFAMQESSCNPNTVGGGGEQGLMQLSPALCGSSPDGICKDPDFNIRTAAKLFADNLDSNGGNFLLALGQYNGWYKGLTFEKATLMKNSSCCRCQNNLDYLAQFVNGWLQNINAYDPGYRIGKYFNLDQCH